MPPYVSLYLSVPLCVVERIEIDIEYHTMRTKGPLTAMRTIATEGMVGDPFHVCVGDTTVKCSSNRQCTSKGLTGGCQPHPAEASVMSMDLNKDGRVSYEELVESVNVNMKESFDMLDVAPNDGEITLVREICIIVHVGGTRYVTSSTDNIMKIHARITLTVEFIRGYIFIFLFYV